MAKGHPTSASPLWRFAVRVAQLIGGLSFLGLLSGITAVVAFWDTVVCQKFPEIVPKIPFAKCQPQKEPVSSVDQAVLNRQQIAAAGYTLDNAGYMKATAQGSEVKDLYKHLNIRGDQASLRQLLLTHPVTSVEFRNLAEFMSKAHSEHFAAPVRSELVELLFSVEKAKSWDALKAVACGTKTGTFSEKFLALNLRHSCASGDAWKSQLLAFGEAIGRGLEDQKILVWWVGYAPTVLRQAPASTPVVQQQSGPPRTITGAELVAWLYDHSKVDHVQADINILLYNTIMAGRTHLAVVVGPWEEYLNSPTKLGPYEIDSEKYRKHECVVVGNRAPKCMARVRFLRTKANEQARAVGIENMKSTGYYPECKSMGLYYKC